jgi:hypothetical protein
MVLCRNFRASPQMNRNLGVGFVFLGEFQDRRLMNKDLQSYLKNIRSDAAECLVLGSIVADEKRQVFIRTAEHLNGLAAGLEKSLLEIGADKVSTTGHKERSDLSLPPANMSSPPLQPSQKPRRLFPWLFGILFGATIATLIFAINPAQTYWFAINAKHEPGPHPQDNSIQSMVLLLFSSEQAERKLLSDQIAAIVGRLGGIESSLDELKKAGTEAVEPTSTASVPAPKAPVTEAGPPPVERAISTAENTLENPPSPKQSDAVGPRGCNLFRSFDPRSGTYVTLDGRRRQCR